MYSPRLAKFWQTLGVLVYNAEVLQGDLPKQVGCSYRTILRQLQLLENLGLARIRRTDPAKRGKARNVWEATFKGIMMFLGSEKFDNKTREFVVQEINQIAEAHKDKWLLFREWSTFSETPEVLKLIATGIIAYCAKHSQMPRVHSNTKRAKELEAIIETMGVIPSSTRYFDPYWEEFEIKEATRQALCLNMVFAGAWPPWLDTPEGHSHVVLKLWKLCMSNASLKKFIHRQFEWEEGRYQAIHKFKDFFESLCSQ